MIAAGCLPTVRAAPDSEGFTQLFDGKTLNGWDGDPSFWSVEDGALTGTSTKEHLVKSNTFLVWRDGEVDDFELRASFKLIGGNSGIQYRSREIAKWVMSGYQGDMEAGDTYTGIMYEERARGILAERGKKVHIDASGKKEVVETLGDTKALQTLIKKEDWNEYKIIARGNHLTHVINGTVMSETIDDQKEAAAKIGLLALQLHAGMPMKVQFKDIRLKRLPLKEGKKIVLVAGKASHPLGEHEFPAGISAIRKCLDKTPGVIGADYYNGWPKDPTAFDNADAILFYMDGGSGHPIIQDDRLKVLDALAKKGVGIACAHYAVEVPADKGGKELKEWIGGYYETNYSINPHWMADIKSLPDHPITRGVKPFSIKDEWYYNIRFRDDMKGVIPILKATPPDATRTTEDSKKHPGREEIMAYAVERADGGRGFGFTGGHFHANWGDENFRKLFLNALLWVAKAEVPANGVESKLTDDEMNGKLRSRTGATK